MFVRPTRQSRVPQLWHMKPVAALPVANCEAYGVGSPWVTEKDVRLMSIAIVNAVPELRWQAVQWHA